MACPLSPAPCFFPCLLLITCMTLLLTPGPPCPLLPLSGCAQALKANPEGAPKELKINANYITKFGQVGRWVGCGCGGGGGGQGAAMVLQCSCRPDRLHLRQP